jgi:hypothetical protein
VTKVLHQNIRLKSENESDDLESVGKPMPNLSDVGSVNISFSHAGLTIFKRLDTGISADGRLHCKLHIEQLYLNGVESEGLQSSNIYCRRRTGID